MSHCDLRHPDLFLAAEECQQARRNSTAVTWAEGVVLTYEATQNETCNGIRVPKHFYCSSVWVERDGEWFIAMYRETPATE